MNEVKNDVGVGFEDLHVMLCCVFEALAIMAVVLPFAREIPFLRFDWM